MTKTEPTRELTEKVVETYSETQSFKQTAAKLKISTAKVRKSLLTAGVWTNDTAEEIEKLREEHSSWTDQQIADYLHVSLNTVQMYTPYKLGPYDLENRGASATRMAKYRERNRSRIGIVDGNRKEVAALIVPPESDPFDLPLDDTSGYEEEKKRAEAEGLPFPKFRSNPNGVPHVDDQFFLDYRLVEPAHEIGRHNSLKSMKLRLEVETDNLSTEQLVEIKNKYGVKGSWYRDVIVPSCIPLHYLHYVIQNAFGFDNSQPHIFQMTEEQFSCITEDSLREYCRLCGILFRFPFGNDEEIHWDDDYDGKKSIRTWMKEKYTGCWNLRGGTGYTYSDNQYRIWQWLKGPDFHELKEVFYAEDEEAFLEEKGATEYCEIEKDWEKGQFPYNNILESIQLDEILAVEPEGCSWEDLKEIAEEELLDNLFTLEDARNEMDAAGEIYKTLDKRMKSGVWDEDTLLVRRWRETAKRAAHLYSLCSGGATVSPCFTSLIYSYKSERDKGRRDNVNHEPWKIRVTVLDEYYDSSIYYGRNYYAADATGAPFRNDPEHEAEWADRLHAMCYWKDKLEVTDKEGRWIRPKDEKDMMIELQPEQELLPEEKAEIGRVESYGQGCKGTVVDDDLYKALRRVILDMAPVCVAKEGAEMNGRNLKPENVV